MSEMLTGVIGYSTTRSLQRDRPSRRRSCEVGWHDGAGVGDTLRLVTGSQLEVVFLLELYI